MKILFAKGLRFNLPPDHLYLHFTTRARARKSVKEMRILHGQVAGRGVFAIPAGGRYCPGIQRYDSTGDCGYADSSHGRPVEAKRGSKNYAVLFTTDHKPCQAYVDEVRWDTKNLDSFISLTLAEIITLQQAREMLNETLTGEERWGN